MVAPRKTRKILCAVVTSENPRLVGTSNRRIKPSDMVPWADPYSACLVKRLQDEVRRQRAQVHDGSGRAAENIVADLEPPYPDPDMDFEWMDEPWRSEHDHKPR